MEDRGDWFADTEGNLTGPGDAKPPTDEFGRDDPASIERERRRREREQRRGKSRKAKAPKRPKAETAPPAEAAPRAEAPPAAKPAKPRRRLRKAEAPQPQQVAQAATVTRRTRRKQPPPPPPPGVDGDGGDPGGGPKKPRGAFRRRRVLALGLILLGGLLVWFLVAFFQPPPFDPGNGNGTQEIVTIPNGATAGDVADILTSHNVVSNGTLFQWRLRLAGDESKILPGRYVMAQDMSYGAAIDKLTSSGGQVTVTIPEGEDRTQIASTTKQLGLTGDYLAASKSFPGFDPNKYGAKNPKDLEGFLFPATYQLNPGANVSELVNKQLQAFQQNIAGVNMSYAKSKNLTTYDVLTIASMINKEVQVPSEAPLVAAVIYNRLSRGMPLGIDATTRFEYHNYTGAILESQLQSQSPYNTRNHAGLPPGPIGNPGLAAIQAAAHPAKVPYLYYVLEANGNGHHCFTASGSEFNQLVADSNAGRTPANCRH
jgi:UPF0755 protein